jgi:hypothetical protein
MEFAQSQLHVSQECIWAETFANLALLIVPHAKTKTHAQVALQDSLFPKSISHQLSLTQCARKFVVMEKDLNTLVMMETQTIMMAAMINVKLKMDGAAQEEPQLQKVFVWNWFPPEASLHQKALFNWAEKSCKVLLYHTYPTAWLPAVAQNAAKSWWFQ